MMMRRRSTCAMKLYLLAAAVLALAALVSAADPPTDGCCATCIGKTPGMPYDYDPLNFDQCGDKTTRTDRLCCFGCGETTAASPEFANAEYVDGTTPTVKAGEWIQITWPNIARVTYEALKKSQAKTVTPKNASAEATLENGVFFICAKAEGQIIIRGWGADPCYVSTTEAAVTISAGTGTGTCAERTPSAPTSGSKNSNSNTDSQITCNLQRASIVKVDGNDTCVCASEWTGAPECAGYPWWKILVTVGGGIAAVLSIAVSVKAFMNSRKAKQAEAERMDKNDAILGEESITIAGGHNGGRATSNNYHDNYHQQQQAPVYHQHPATIKAQDNKEYSL